MTPRALLREKGRVTAFIKDIVKEYQAKLLLDRHDIVVVPQTDKDGSYMEMRFRLPYLDPEMNWNPEKVLKSWRDGNFDEIKQAVIHELCHILTDPLYGLAVDRHATKDTIERERETTTDHIAMIIKKSGI